MYQATKGFTLLEAAISIGLLSFSFLGLLSLLLAFDKVEAENAWAAKALLCAQQAMEELRFETALHGSPASGEDKRISGGAYQGMQKTWKINTSSVEPGLLEIRVECSCLLHGKRIRKGLETRILPTT